MIYHLTTHPEWDQALTNDGYTPSAYAKDGFIHCSDLFQLEGVANNFYRNLDDLIVLEINPQRAAIPLVYENLEGGSTLYPHLYGSPLPLEAIQSVFTMLRDAQGTLHLPSDKKPPKPSLFTLLPYNQPGPVHRSVMPGSFMFDPEDKVLSLYQESGIQTVVVLNPVEDLHNYTSGDLFARYQSAGIQVIHAPAADFSAPLHGTWNT
ncbi:MAG: DUF952 domain-containing protein, partial [Anaerolineaceae bacterium]